MTVKLQALCSAPMSWYQRIVSRSPKERSRHWICQIDRERESNDKLFLCRLWKYAISDIGGDRGGGDGSGCIDDVDLDDMRPDVEFFVRDKVGWLSHIVGAEQKEGMFTPDSG